MSVKTFTVYEKVKIWEIYGAIPSADGASRYPLTKTPAIDVNFLKKKRRRIVREHRLKPDVVVINYPQSSLNRSIKLADRWK